MCGAIYQRRDGCKVGGFAGVDLVTGRQHRISRQVHGSRGKAEKKQARLKPG